MNTSHERSARLLIQRLRPAARKHGLRRTIVEVYLREHLPKKYQRATWDEMKMSRDYETVRESAEHYRPHFNPDLSEVYPDDREIIIYEIEDKCSVTPAKFRAITFWIDVTMNDWDEWSLILITTNRFGLGWDTLIDTKAEGMQWALSRLKEDRDQWVRHYPTLDSEKCVRKFYSWRNWKMPENPEFAEARSHRLVHEENSSREMKD